MTIDQISDNQIDLRGTPCPVNFVKCNLALEELSHEDILIVILDKGEPEIMVIPGLENAGHKVQIVHEESTWVRLKVICGER